MEEPSMKSFKFTEEQIAFALRRAEAGKRIADICWRPGRIQFDSVQIVGFSVYRVPEKGGRMSSPVRFRPVTQGFSRLADQAPGGGR